MNCFGELSNKFASKGCPIDLLKLGSMFSRTKTFCFENRVFLTIGLGMCEGVSEGLRSGKGCDAPNFRGSFFFFFLYKSSMYFSYTYPKYMKLYCSNIFLQNAAQGHNPTFFALMATMEHKLLVYLKGGSHNGVSKAQ